VLAPKDLRCWYRHLGEETDAGRPSLSTGDRYAPDTSPLTSGFVYCNIVWVWRYMYVWWTYAFEDDCLLWRPPTKVNVLVVFQTNGGHKTVLVPITL